MKTNVTKKLGSLVLALAIAFTAVFATATPVEAATNYTTVYSSTDAETAYANTEVKIPFTVTANEGIDVVIVTPASASATLTLYTASGSVYSANDNPLYNATFQYDSSIGLYYYEDGWYSIPAGDYYYGITFSANTEYMVQIDQMNAAASISQKKATITAGFTKKLSVSGGTVKSWTSKNKKIAKVDKNGKVTAVKAGSTTIVATLTDGTKLTCKVTVKANKYSASKITTSDVSYGAFGFEAYSASYDSKGNLVVKVRLANNSSKKISELRSIKVTVKDPNGKAVGTYKLSKKSVSIPAYSTKDFSFTIKKSALKKKTKVDLRNSSVKADANAYYYYYY